MRIGRFAMTVAIATALAAGGEQVLSGDGATIRWSGLVVAALLYVAVCPSLIAYWAWGQGVARAGPASAISALNRSTVSSAASHS